MCLGRFISERELSRSARISLVFSHFSILVYCDKYLKLEGMINSVERIRPTIEELWSIRSYVSNLLSLQTIRQILPTAIESRNQFNILLNLMLKRIEDQKIPRPFEDP
jgi:hypothetical protein